MTPSYKFFFAVVCVALLCFPMHVTAARPSSFGFGSFLKSFGTSETRTSTTTNGCADSADHTKWEAGKANFSKDMRTCGLKCIFNTQKCVTSCMQKAHGYSDGCAGCLGDLAQCTKAHCESPCMLSSSNPTCVSCVKSNCDPAFATCSGITSSDMPPSK
mmetsp:Transcript_31973/g.38663  ORF Transcript_31973/g.38663 Transcript_31973/m.38663 type:complete len:159 (+) Transcript_31973:139-615(+)